MMGYYINPEDGTTKEDWLEVNASAGPFPRPRLKFDFTSPLLPVCLVHNGSFTAAGICYDEHELATFSQPDDHRPKLWFEVERSRLASFLPEKYR